MALEITIRDVIGTAHVGAAVAASKLDALLQGESIPTLHEFEEIVVQLNKTLSDVMLAKHMSDGWWDETTYVGRWS